MNKTIILLILLFTIISTGPKLFAQLDSLSSGDRIRLTSTSYFFQPTIATFYKLNSDTLFFSIHSRTSSIPINLLQKLEFPVGKEKKTVIGMIAGSIAGGLILGIVMHLNEKQSGGFEDIGQPGFWGGFASGALIGGGVGALIGSQINSEEWKQIYIGRK